MKIAMLSWLLRSGLESRGTRLRTAGTPCSSQAGSKWKQPPRRHPADSCASHRRRRAGRWVPVCHGADAQVLLSTPRALLAWCPVLLT